jgi:signal transduction histidine kinase
MLRKKVHFPIFIVLMLLCLGSCNKSIKNKELNNKAYDSVTDLAEASLKKQEYEKAFKYYSVSKTLTNPDDAIRKIYTLGKLAEIYRVNGDYLESEATATEAFEFFDDCKEPAYKVYIYNCLGINFQEKEDFANALKYYEKAYQLASTDIDKIIIRNNMAVVNLEKQDYKKVIAELKPLTANDTLRKYPMYYAKVLDNLGFGYYNLKMPEGYGYLKQALVIRDSLKDDFETFPSYLHFSKYYLKNNPDLSLEFATKAYEAATRINNPDDRLEALNLLIKNSSGEALKRHFEKYTSLNNETLKARQRARNAFAAIKYDSTKAIQNEQKYKSNMQISIFVAAFMVIFGAYVVYSIRKRNKKKLQASVYETEKRISKKIHDELANDVFQTMAFAETQNLQEQEIKETLMDNLENIYSKARDISQTNSEIPTEERFGDFLLDLINSFNSNEINIIVKNSATIDWNKIQKESKIAVYRVIQELLVNMKKHSGANLVMISFENKPKLVELKYSDNGQGIEIEKITKRGLQNAENRIHAVKGTFTFDQETTKGFRVTIQIPK